MKRLIEFNSIRMKILLAFLIVDLLLTVAFAAYTYFLQSRTILDGIDNKLKVAALSVESVLPDGFHDRIESSNSISAAEHAVNLRKLTDYAKATGVTFVYSFVKVGDTIYFTSTSCTDEQFKKGTTLPFFEKYDPSPGVVRMFQTGEVLKETAKDDFGTFRSVLVPMKDAKGRLFVVGADIYIDEVNERLQKTMCLCISIGLGSFLAVVLLAMVLSNRITRPIVHLTEHARKLAANNFTPDQQNEEQLARMAQRADDEVRHLATAFSEMMKKLDEYIQNLKATTAAKERIESELKIAHDIQMSLLKKVFPPFPKRQDFDLYAMLEPAKEVGGDLYDFFFLDEDRLFFHVGDVSDKGVPAALFMAVTMALMKRSAQQNDISPAEVLKQVNSDLCQENENALFVTLVCGIINLKTGEIVYSNAGHNPPLILRAGGSVEWMKLPDGMVLGVMPESPYETRTVNLRKGDMLVLYTDGVTEAMNPMRQLYSDQRLFDTVATLAGREPGDVVKEVVKSVKTHASTAPQSDDITMMALKLR